MPAAIEIVSSAVGEAMIERMMEDRGALYPGANN